MLLVVFGAGASYDSSPDMLPQKLSGPFVGDSPERFRPPLAVNLFENRVHFTEALTKHPELIPVASLLRPKADRSLEQELQRFQAEADKIPSRHKEIAAIRFYLREIISSCDVEWRRLTRRVTNYTTLLRHFHDGLQTGLPGPVCLVTFNYDTLLEDALKTGPSSDQVEFSDITHYIANDRFKLFKLHGSVDWLQAVNIQAKRHVDARQAIRMLVDDASNYKPLDDAFRLSRDIQEYMIEDFLAMPAIAIPLERGKTFVCPSPHLDELKTLLPRTTHLLLVGWRGMEQHFVDLLSENINKEIRGLVVSRSREGATSIAKHLKDSGVKGQYTPFDGGFSAFVQTDLAKKFLSW